MNAPARPVIVPAKIERRAATPVAGAIAGMLFAVLFGVSVMIMTNTMADLTHDTGAWLETGAGTFKFALGLIPFAGLFFLWFIAVARERLGRFEDQFFSTVFLGSGLLFLAMIFAAAASAGAIVATYAKDPTGFAASSTYMYARQMVGQIFSVYALRMAAIFLISQATLWLRTGVMPRWMALRVHAGQLGHPGVPGVGVLRERVHPRYAPHGAPAGHGHCFRRRRRAGRGCRGVTARRGGPAGSID
jgi:hypothetical protein